MFENTPYFGARCALLTVALLGNAALRAAPPTAIRMEPLGIAPGQKMEVIIHGTNLANATGLLPSIGITSPQSSFQLLNQTDSSTPLPESKLANSQQPTGAIVIEAEDYSRGKYRRAGIFILNGDFSPNYAEYDVEVAAPGNYQLELKYAAGSSRPVKLFLNGRLVTDQAAAGVTGGFSDTDAKWMVEGVIELQSGKNVLRLERAGGTPHFDKLALVPTAQPVSQFSATKPSDRVAPLQALISNSCPIGIYGLRIATAEGVSDPLLFMVDDLPTQISPRDNHSMDSAQAVELPTAIDGVTESGHADFFQFSGTAGQWISIEAVATRLGTKLDPVIRLLDAAGRELAFVDDSPALAGDCRLRIQLPETGTCFVTIEDSALGGSSGHEYHLRIGDFPLLPGRELTNVMASATHHITGTDKQSFTPVEFPGSLSGVFADARDLHRFRFAAQKGDRILLTDRSRELGAAAMLGLAIRDATGKLVGENRRAGTSGGSLTVGIPADGFYDAELSELTQRSGPDYFYCAELRRSVPDFELTLDAASVILPQDGYAIVKVTAIRNGYNGPIRLSVAGSGGELTVASNVIAEKKNDTRLKVYVPKNLQAGQPMTLQIFGTSEVSDPSPDNQPLRKVASTLSVLRKEKPQTPHPPTELQHELAGVVGRAIPDFFALSLDDGAIFFPRYVGEVYFTVRVKDRTDGFKDEVALRVEGLPDGFKANGGERAVSRSDNNEYRFLLSGPTEMALGTREIQIIGEASFKGQTKEVTLAKLPLRIIEPLIVTVAVEGETRPGAKQKINVKARRFVPRAGGDMKAITLKLADGPAGFTLSESGIIAAARKETPLEIQVAENVRPGTYSLTLEATTEVTGHKFSVLSAPFQLTIASP
ncbi:MAG: hypothetical protein HQ518_20985 [Rhodopirellula sp.]|nr:hypothetical protein [Rhodopirellula sp.]